MCEILLSGILNTERRALHAPQTILQIPLHLTPRHLPNRLYTRQLSHNGETSNKTNPPPVSHNQVSPGYAVDVNHMSRMIPLVADRVFPIAPFRHSIYHPIILHTASLSLGFIAFTPTYTRAKYIIFVPHQNLVIKYPASPEWH
jgi:hypothetical protein